MNEALQKLIDDNKWRPIEDAPKDKVVELQHSNNRRSIAKLTKQPLDTGYKWFVAIPCMSGIAQATDGCITWEEDHPLAWRNVQNDLYVSALQVAVEALVEVHNSDDAHEIWFQQIAHEALQKIQQIAEDE